MPLTVSLIGTPNQLDVYKSSWNTSSKTKFVGSGLTSIRIEYERSSRDDVNFYCAICAIQVFVGGSLWRTIDFRGGDVLWSTCDYCVLLSKEINNKPDKKYVDVGLYEQTSYMSGNPWEESIVTQSSEPRFGTSGNKAITVKVWYKPFPQGSHSGNFYSECTTETFSCGSVSVINPYCDGITLSGGKREFYAPDPFDYSTLVVTGRYKYTVDGGSAYTAPVTGYQISDPSYLFSVAQHSQGAGGYVTVTYAGRTSSYYINVYGIKEYTKPKIRSIRNTPYFRVGETPVVDNAVITYGDGTTETEAPTLSAFSTATPTAEGTAVTVTHSVYADKVQKTLSWEEQCKVLPMYITLDTNGVKKNFDANEAFNASSLVVSAHYGYDNNAERDLAGVETISLADQNLTIAPPTWRVGANKVVTITYTDGHQTKTTNYTININGLYALDLDDSAYKEGLSVEKNGTLEYGSLVARVRRYVDGTLSDWETWQSTISLKEGLDTSVAGKTYASFYVEENGAMAGADLPVNVFEIIGIDVGGMPREFFYTGNEYPKLRASNLRVYAKIDSGDYIELSYNAISKGYEIVINGTVQSQDEITLTEDTTVTIRSKTANDVAQDFVIRVTEKAAVSGAALMVQGGTAYVSVGEQIDKSNYRVFQFMNDGTYAEVSDFDCVISGKSGLTFGPGDAIGQYYDLVFTKSPSAAKTLQNAAFLDGVSSVTNVSIGKTVYEIGDVFNASEITCVVNYFHAESRQAQFRVGTDSCSVSSFSAQSAGQQEIPLTLYGKQASLTVYVRKVIALTKVATDTPTYGGYRIHDALDPNGHGYKFQKTYDYAIDGEDTYDLEDSQVSFAFSNAGTGCSAADIVPSLSSQQISVTPSYTENGITVQGEAYSIYARRLKSVKLINASNEEVESIHIDSGDALDLSPYRLHVEFNNGDVTDIGLSAESASANPANGTIIVSKVSNATVGYTFVRNDSIFVAYTIHVHYVSEIQTNLNTLIGETYFVGDVIDLSAITASREIASTDQSESGYPLTQQFTPRILFDSMSVSGEIQIASPGSHTISFTDSGITKSATFTAGSVVLSSISTARSVAFKPLSDYVEGQRLDLTGLTVTKAYNDGTTETLSADDPNIQLVDSNGDAVSKRKEISLSDDGVELFVKVVENGVTKTAAVEEISGSPAALAVAPNELSSIEIMPASTHETVYTYGDRFSLDGMLVKANFTNGTAQGVPLQSLSISGVGAGHQFNPTDDQTFGTIHVSLSYTYGGITKSASYDIALVKPTLTAITTNAATDAVISKYVDGDIYSEDGLVVTGVFANGWTYAIPTQKWNTNGTTVLSVNGSTGAIQMTGNYGAKTITVSAQNPFDENQQAVTTTYSVDILTSGQIVAATLMFDEGVDYADYTVGDVFDAKGAYFHIADIDGVETDVRSFTTNPAIGTILRKAQRLEVSCTYVKGNFTHTATYTITVSVPETLKLTETNDYKLAIGRMDGSLFSAISHEEQAIALGKTYDERSRIVSECYPLFHEGKVQIDNNPAHAATYGYNVYTGTDADGDCIGYIDLGANDMAGDTIRQAHVVLFDDPLNPIDGQGNIEVTFPHYVDGLADRINKCRFGTVYNNRLFLSGNPDFKSCDWHSGAVNVSQDEDYDRNANLDFTYFSDLDYCYYGTDDTAIVGYDIHRDGDLLVVKQGSKHEATLYRRSYKLVAAQAYDGTQHDTSLAEEAFPMYDINANGGIGGLSHRSIISFVGETLVLTKEGLKAIIGKDGVYNTAKYSVDVSTFINPKITSEGLDKAFIFAHDEKMYLKTDRGVYVGYNELRNEQGEYEWYYLCDLEADMFFECDGELYFANDEGEMFRFPTDKRSYIDRDRDFIGYGGTYLTLDEANNRVITSNAYADLIKEGKTFHLLTEFNVSGADVRTQIHASLGYFVNANHRANMLESGGIYDDTLYNGTFDPETDEIEVIVRNYDGSENVLKTIEARELFYDGRKVKFDSLTPQNTSSIALYEEYTLSKTGDGRYKIINAAGNVVSLSGTTTMRICFVVNDLSVTRIQDVQPFGNDGAKSFTLEGDHSRTLDLVYYNNQNGYYSGIVTTENSVKAYYVTVPYSMGSISASKTIWGWVLANDTNLTSFMDIGYITSRKQTGFKTLAKAHQLRFDGLDFSKMTILNDSLPHVYVQYKTLPAVNFIRFVLKNEEDSNLALTAMDVIYTFNGLTKGVR